MSKYLLNEQCDDQSTLEAAIIKARVRSPLTSEELDSLVGMDIASLIVEHNLSYPEAEIVMSWRKNEILRFNAQDISYGGPDEPLISERITGRPRPQGIKSLRRVIREELDNIFGRRVK